MTNKEEILVELMTTTLGNCKQFAEWEGGEFVDDYKRFSEAFEEIIKDFEVLGILKQNPELVWWCCCYETADEMIIDRKSFMLDYSIEEIREQFNKVKEWLENDNNGND